MPGSQKDSPGRDNGYQMVDMDTGETKKPPKLSPHLAAAEAGKLTALKEALDALPKPSVFEMTPHEESALHLAANQADLDLGFVLATEILSRTAKGSPLELKLINMEDSLQQTAIMMAAARGNDSLVDLLLNKGATLGFNFRNESVFFILAGCANHKQANLCAEVIFNFFGNATDQIAPFLNSSQKSTNYSPLHKAAIHGNYGLIKLFISKGANALQTDLTNSTVLHVAVDNAFENVATECTRVIMQDFLTNNWEETKSQLLQAVDISGRCAIHIAARRGFEEILGLLIESCTTSEGITGFNALHVAANLGNPKKSVACVQKLLEFFPGSAKEKISFLDAQDANGATPLYLAATQRNIEACEALMLAGSKFDIKTNRGKTPLEKVYEKVPQAVRVQLEEAVKNSGYVAYRGTINDYVELDFGPILGYSSSSANIYKETEDLAKVCYAKFEDRKEFLHHPFIRIFIYEKWEKIKHFFFIFRLIHILWFLFNFYLVVNVYRAICPYESSQAFSWVNLRPVEEDINATTSLSECEIGSGTQVAAGFNLVALILYALSQIHQTKQRFHWLFRPVKPSSRKQNCCAWAQRLITTTFHYISLILRILPTWPLILGCGIAITTLPILKIQPFPDHAHYGIAGVMGFLTWLSIYFELGKIPKFRVYINLLIKSTQTLLWAITISAPILFGFATVFVILMPGEASFSSAIQSFVKVITFMIGELDYSGLFYGDDKKESIFSGVVMLSLAVFVVFIVLLLVNFLIGLAAEEIRDFYERAEIWKLCTELEQIVMLESFLDESVSCFGRDILKQNLMLMPPEWNEKEKKRVQKRRAIIYIPGLPQPMQKELHELNLSTIREVR